MCPFGCPGDVSFVGGEVSHSAAHTPARSRNSRGRSSSGTRSIVHMSPMEKVTEQPMPMPPTPPLQTPPSTIEALTPSLPSSSPSPATGGDDEEHAHGTDLSEATIITI